MAATVGALIGALTWSGRTVQQLSNSVHDGLSGIAEIASILLLQAIPESICPRGTATVFRKSR
jgi:hypothetical protein